MSSSGIGEDLMGSNTLKIWNPMNKEQKKRLHEKHGKFVEIDNGFFLDECWTGAKVIDERLTSELFGNKLSTELLVELHDKTRQWVSGWRPVRKGTK